MSDMAHPAEWHCVWGGITVKQKKTKRQVSPVPQLSFLLIVSMFLEEIGTVGNYGHKSL